MKNLPVILFASFLIILSCKKNSDIIHPGPGFTYSYLTIMSGDSYKTCYRKLQQLYNDNQIISMYVQDKGYLSIDNFKELIGLYSEFRIVEINGNVSGDTIDFFFDMDTLKWISDLNIVNPLTGGPTQLDQWPDNADSVNVINKGDNKEMVSDKLLSLEADGNLENRLYKLLYTMKDLDTAFDSNSEKSDLWSITETYNPANNKQYYFNIYFAEGVVNGIEINEVQFIGLN